MNKLIDCLENIHKNSSTLAKQEYMVDLFEKTKDDEHRDLYLTFIANEILPLNQKYNIGNAIIQSAVASMSGYKYDIVKEKTRELGSVSLACEYCLANKKQFSLFDDEPMGLVEVYKKLKILPTLSAQSDKENIIKSILTSQSPRDIRYLVNMISQDLPLGYKRPIIAKALSQFMDKDELLIRRAYIFTNSFTKLLHTEILEELELIPCNPFLPELAKGMSFDDIEEFSNDDIIETKYDGGRIDAHLTEDDIKLYTRKLEDVTKQFPEIVQGCINTRNMNLDKLPIIFDSEIEVGTNFADFSRRIQRKKDIDEFAKELPATLKVFDIVYCQRPLYDENLKYRKKILSTIDVDEIIEIVPYQSTKGDKAFVIEQYEKALELGHEGIIVKDLYSSYMFDERDEAWLKFKPTTTIDVRIVDANFGTGGNANLYSSYVMATEEGLVLGAVGSGASDEIIAEVDERWRNNDKNIIFEVSFEGMQKSPKNSSGYGIRFPRIIAIRNDKGKATTMEEILSMKDVKIIN